MLAQGSSGRNPQDARDVQTTKQKQFLQIFGLSGQTFVSLARI